MNRRHLFTLAPAAALGLAGCATTDARLASLAADVATIDAALQAVAPSIARAADLSPNVQSDLLKSLAALHDAAGQITAASSGGSAPVSAVQAFARALNAAVQVAALVPGLPAPVALGLQAAAALLPGIEALAGLAGAPQAAPLIPPDAARSILAGLAKESK